MKRGLTTNFKSMFASTHSLLYPTPTYRPIPIPQSTLNPALKMRHMTLRELKVVFGWASGISWDLTSQDAEVCYRSDPKGFFIGEINGKPICSYLCYRFGDYYYLTMNIVAEEHRGIGYGKMIQAFAKQHYYPDAKVVSFEAADEGIARYRRLGYKDLCGMIIYKKTAKGYMSPNAVDLKDLPTQELFDYDLEVFKYPRENFLMSCVQEKSYKAIGIKKDGKLRGFGILRNSTYKDAYSLSLVTAEDKETGKEVLESLQSFVVGKDVYAVVLDANLSAMELMKEQNWSNTFECIRMYGPEMPKN